MSFFLNLPDPEPALYERAEYSIRLAGKVSDKTIWDQNSGWNRLFHTLTIE